MRLDVIVVVYNVALAGLPCADPAWQGEARGRVIVCDNSDDALARGNAAYASRLPHVVYVGMGGNVGISRAYNVALSRAEADFVCILDDDTPVPADYLARVATHVGGSPADVFVPVVRAGGLIYSPSRRGLLTFRPVRSLDEIGSVGSFGFINSGMALRRASLSETPFDERLFLDYVDHAFMRKAVAAGLAIEVMPEIEIAQRFSFQADDRETERRRLSVFARDTRTYFGRSPLGRLRGTMAIAGRALRLATKYGVGFFMGGGGA